MTFAWIAAEPGEERHQRFLKSDTRARLDADADARNVGAPLLSTGDRQKYERQLRELPKEMPKLRQRTEAADMHWAEHLPGFEAGAGVKSYSGLYATAYRHHSAIAHPTLMGLNPVTVDLPDGTARVQLEQRDPGMQGPVRLGVAVLTLSLYMAAETLNSPASADVSAVFA